jgi:hypothetical protein
MKRMRLHDARGPLLCLLVCTALAAGCTPSTGKSDGEPKPGTPAAVVIAQVRTDRTAIDPAKSESIAFKFNLSAPADVTLSVQDGRDRVVFQSDARSLAAGDREIRWDGRSTKGTALPAEAYTYTLRADSGKGGSTYDLTDLTGGQRIQARDVRWDAQTGTIRYYLDKPARVNLRIGLEEGPYLRTVVDWVPRPAGEHAERWDGRDASGVLDLSANPALRPVVAAYTLPDNTVFVGAPPQTIAFVAEKDTLAQRERKPTGSKQIANSAQQPLDTRGDVQATLVPIGQFPRDAEGRWIVSGVVPFRVDVADADRERVVQRRFEAVYYVDGVFTYENELGYLPMTWKWDTGNINPGEHFVTLNIRGYEGNFGAATVKVLVERSDGASQTSQPAKGK